METIHGAGSWRLANDTVTLHVSRDGGMVAPVEFKLGERTVSPYALAPWKPDEVDASVPALLRFLRGDFFCLPFGPQQDGPPHGETANSPWEKTRASDDELRLALTDSLHGARIEKRITLRPGHAAIYYDHRISNLEGRWSYGNHPILDASALPEGTMRVSVSPFRWASVYPGMFSAPERDEFQSLQPSARFERLDSVTRFDSGLTDLTRWPVRQGNDDLVMMVNEPATGEQPFAWSAAVFERYVWFSLKNPSDFPATLLWMSNGGRPGVPWERRHLGRLGIEEVCSHFCDGVDVSRESHLDADIPTTRLFKRDEEVSLRIVQAVAAVPGDFGLVTSITPAGSDKVLVRGGNGDAVEAAVDWNHVL